MEEIYVYTYQVTLVDKDNKCLEVKYMSPGREALHVGVRYPNEGETLEDVIKQYSPAAIWREKDRQLSSVDIQLGHSGIIKLVQD